MAPSAKETDVDALKARYISIVRDNNIAPNFKDIQVTVPPLHGDHFASSCDYLTIVQENGEKLELFTKRMVDNPQYSQMLRETKVFDKEAGFFNVLVPMLNKFIESRVKPGTYELDMLPKAYFADGEMIIMENLAKKNYILLDKVARQDLNQAKMYMRTLAKFQAPSYLMLKEEKSIEDFTARHGDIMMEAFNSKFIGDWMNPIFKVVVEILKSDPSTEGREALEIAKELESNVVERLLEPLKFEHGHVCFVLNHGDTWNSNMLFRQDPVTKKLDHHVLVDFQCYRTTSPNTDLSYYMFSSVKCQVRQTEWKNLLRLYYDEFTAHVTYLKGTVDFSFEEFVADFKRKFSFGFLIGVAMLASVGAMSSVGDLEKIEGDIMEHISASVSKWSQEDPERTKRIAQELTGMIQEYKQLNSTL